MRLLGVIHRELSIELHMSINLGRALGPAKAIERLPGQGQWTLSVTLLVWGRSAVASLQRLTTRC